MVDVPCGNRSFTFVKNPNRFERMDSMRRAYNKKVLTLHEHVSPTPRQGHNPRGGNYYHLYIYLCIYNFEKYFDR